MKRLTHQFVETLPQPLEEGVIYVSTRFRLVAHNCCCGCGNPVIVNLAPTGWRLTFDGESISLNPSIGNWDFPCRSHYWITRNYVKWAEAFTVEEIARAKTFEALGGNTLPDKLNPKKAKPSLWSNITRIYRGKG